MPLVDFAELETELAAKPEYLTQLFEKRSQDAVKFLTDKGHVVKAKTEYDTDIDTKATEKAKVLNQEAIDNEGAKFFGSVDRMLSFATGQTKPDKMRTRDWVAKLEDEGLLPFSQAQIEKLQKALKGNGQNPLDKSVIDELEKKIKALEEGDPEKSKVSLQKDANRLIKTDLRNANVLIDSTLKTDAEKSSAKSDAIQNLTALFQAGYEPHKDDDDEIYFTKKGSTDALVDATNKQYLSPLEIIKKYHKIFLAPENHQQQGGGSGKPTGGGAVTLDSIYRAAAAASHAFGSKEWKEFVAEQKKAAGIQ